MDAGTAVDKLDDGNPRLGDGCDASTVGNCPATVQREEDMADLFIGKIPLIFFSTKK